MHEPRPPPSKRTLARAALPVATGVIASRAFPPNPPPSKITGKLCPSTPLPGPIRGKPSKIGARRFFTGPAEGSGRGASLLRGRKTLSYQGMMSAGLPPITDIARRGWHGRKVPIGDIHSIGAASALLKQPSQIEAAHRQRQCSVASGARSGVIVAVRLLSCCTAIPNIIFGRHNRINFTKRARRRLRAITVLGLTARRKSASRRARPLPHVRSSALNLPCRKKPNAFG